jgi:hypothetical protein
MPLSRDIPIGVTELEFKWRRSSVVGSSDTLMKSSFLEQQEFKPSGSIEE